MLNGDKSGNDWGPYGLSKSFGTKAAMQQYLPTKLVVENAHWLKRRCRLVLGAGDRWKDQSVEMHAVLEQQSIPHVNRPDLLLAHRWDTGWFLPMTAELAKIARAS